MHLDLACGGFSAPYSQLNSLTKVNATWLTIAKNMMALEAEHLQPTSIDWVLCLGHGFSTALRAFHFDLQPRRAFLAKGKTRLAGDSYLAGEAFTRAFAQEDLRASIAMQLDLASGAVVSHGRTASKTKHGVPASRKKGRLLVPDFVAFTGSTPHLLEAKGAAGNRVSPGTLEQNLSDALTQVSRIKDINGLQPATRTGCSYGFDKRGTRGSVWDPDGETESFGVRVNLPAMVRRYYSAFPEDARMAEFDEGFAGIELIPGVSFSVDRKILSEARAVETDDAALAFFERLQRRREELLALERPGIAVGPDGIRLDVPIAALA